MEIIIGYFSYVTGRIVSILDSIKIDDSPSLLYFFLSSIVIAIILKIVKGGSTEFEQNTNFLNGQLTSKGMSKYKMYHLERKKQLLMEKVERNEENQKGKEKAYGQA